MLENQFIQITNTTLTQANSRGPVVLPQKVVNYQQSAATHVYVYIPGEVVNFSLLDADGTVLYTSTFTTQTGYRVVLINNLFFNANNISPLLYGVQYFVRTTTGVDTYRYSNPIILAPDNDGFSNIRYRCDNEAFGFPFSGAEYVSMYLYLRLHSPQYVQEDKTYVKANGQVVTLYAQYYKEWEGETEYLPQEMHDKIVAALSCDEVYIDNKRVTKSDNYQVDWENYDLDCDGVTKLAKATFKVRENITQRNSNY